MKIILASASPRRQELLKYITTDFDVVPSNIDETLPENIDAEKSAECLAVKKAEYIAASFPESIIIGSDTVVVCENEILGKPVDETDAQRMLKLLSGKTHTVITGVCITCSAAQKTQSFSQSTAVKFYPLTDREICDYIASGEPMDKAGAYGIQDKGCVFIEGIEGDFFSVMGLPVARLKRELAEFSEKIKKY